MAQPIVVPGAGEPEEMPQLFHHWKALVEADEIMASGPVTRTTALSQAQGATLPNFELQAFKTKLEGRGGVYKCAGCLDWVNPMASATVGVDIDVDRLLKRVNRQCPTGDPVLSVEGIEIVIPVRDLDWHPSVEWGSLPFVSAEEDVVFVWGCMARACQASADIRKWRAKQRRDMNYKFKKLDAEESKKSYSQVASDYREKTMDSAEKKVWNTQQRVQYVILERSNLKAKAANTPGKGVQKQQISISMLHQHLSKNWMADSSDKFTTTFLPAAVRIGEEFLPVPECASALRQFQVGFANYLTGPMASIYTLLEFVKGFF